MLKKKPVSLVFIIVFLTVSIVSGADFSSMFGQMEKVFPEKYDEVLSRLYRPEDRIVFIFREMIVSQFNENQKIEPVLNGYLKKALNRYWLLESSEYKKAFLADSEYMTKRLQKYCAKLPGKFDLAAFSYFLEAGSDENPALRAMAKTSGMLLQKLNDIGSQKAYIEEINNSRDFYRKIPVLFKPVIKADDKIRMLVDRLQQKFLIEKMIIACDSLISQKNDKIKSALIKLKSGLSRILVEKIASNLETQLETGIEADAVTGIMKSPQGIMVSQVLYQGRIRTFVKEIQKTETLKQLESLLPVMTSVKTELTRLKNSVSNTKSKAVLEKMLQNLDEIALVLKLKLRNSSAASADSAKLTELFDLEISSGKTAEILNELNQQ